jgi:hypothetical protein
MGSGCRRTRTFDPLNAGDCNKIRAIPTSPCLFSDKWPLESLAYFALSEWPEPFIQHCGASSASSVDRAGQFALESNPQSLVCDSGMFSTNDSSEDLGGMFMLQWTCGAPASRLALIRGLQDNAESPSASLRATQSRQHPCRFRRRSEECRTAAPSIWYRSNLPNGRLRLGAQKPRHTALSLHPDEEVGMDFAPQPPPVSPTRGERRRGFSSR